MRILLKLLDFLVVSNVYVATCTFALTCLTLQFYGANNYDLAYFVFFSTLFAYNFMRLVRVSPMLNEGDSLRHKYIFKFSTFLWLFAIVSAVAAVFFFYRIYTYIFYPLLFMGLISVLYSLPVYKKGSVWFRLRDLPTVKIFLIAFVWAGVSSYLPMKITQVPINYLFVFERFLFVFAITIPFDIRDLQFDATGLKTIPQVFGVKKAVHIGVGALLIAEAILFYHYFFLNTYSLPSVLMIYISYELAILLVYKAKPTLSERYFTLGVEGTSILLGLLFFLSEILL